MTGLKADLINRVESEKDQIIELTRALIRIPSQNPGDDILPVMTYIYDHLQKNEVSCTFVSADDHPVSLLAVVGSGKGPCLILNGHADVVPVGDRGRWQFDPFSGEVRDGRILGRGASDMKGGLAGIIYTTCALASFVEETGGTLVLCVVPDEETMGLWGTRWLVETGKVSGDACLVAGPTSRGDVEIGQKGSLWLKVRARGVPAHGSLSPYAGDNAIVRLLPFMSAVGELAEMFPEIPPGEREVMESSKSLARTLLPAGAENVLDHVTVNIGLIRGGTKINVVPEEAEVHLDIRVPVGMRSQTVLNKVRELASRTLGDRGAVEALWCFEPCSTTPRERIVEIVTRNVAEVLGRQATATYQWASSDARYFRYRGIPTVQYGPANLEGIHSYNETVSVEDLISATKVYVGTVVDLMDSAGGVRRDPSGR